MNTIFEFFDLPFRSEIGHPLSIWVTRGMEWGHPKCLQMCTAGEGCHASYVHTRL